MHLMFFLSTISSYQRMPQVQILEGLTHLVSSYARLHKALQWMSWKWLCLGHQQSNCRTTVSHIDVIFWRGIWGLGLVDDSFWYQPGLELLPHVFPAIVSAKDLDKVSRLTAKLTDEILEVFLNFDFALHKIDSSPPTEVVFEKSEIPRTARRWG